MMDCPVRRREIEGEKRGEGNGWVGGSKSLLQRAEEGRGCSMRREAER